MTTLRTALCALLVVACGDSAPKPRPSRTARTNAAAAGQTTTTTAAAPGGKPGTLLQTYPKVPAEYRVEMTKADWTLDVTGDLNRDPFRSYLIDLSRLPGTNAKPEDTKAGATECGSGVVAENFGLRDLKLVGIVLRGTRTYALFIDSQSIGYTAHRGDCLSKDKARVKEIGSDRVTIEIRGQAPPNAPAPPPREEVWKLYEKELDLQPQSGQVPQ